LIRLAESEVKRQATLRIVTAAAHDFGDLFAATRFDRASRTDGASVGPRSSKRESDRVLPGAAVFQQGRPFVQVDDQNLRTPVAVDISGGQTARRTCGGEAR